MLSLLQLFLHQRHELVVLESPAGLCKQVRRRLTDEAIEDDVGACAGNEPGNEAGIAVGGEADEVVGMLQVFLSHGCAADEL